MRDMLQICSDQIEQFAGYGFNDLILGYALIAYQTAWLKTHFPAEFMASVLSCDLGNTDNIQLFCRRLQKHRIIN